MEVMKPIDEGGDVVDDQQEKGGDEMLLVWGALQGKKKELREERKEMK